MKSCKDSTSYLCMWWWYQPDEWLHSAWPPWIHPCWGKKRCIKCWASARAACIFNWLIAAVTPAWVLIPGAVAALHDHYHLQCILIFFCLCNCTRHHSMALYCSALFSFVVTLPGQIFYSKWILILKCWMVLFCLQWWSVDLLFTLILDKVSFPSSPLSSSSLSLPTYLYK